MTGVTFNTLEFTTKLKAAGVPEKEAEVLANSFGEVLQVNLRDLVTEPQLDKAASELKQGMTQIKDELRQEIVQVRNELKQEIAQVRQELKSVETRLDAKIDVAVTSLKSEMHVLKWMTGTMFAAVIAILIRLFFFRRI